MDSIQGARRLLLTIAAVLLLLDAGAIAVLLSPTGRGRDALNQEYNDVREQYQAKLRDSAPARDIDKRLIDARKQTAEFYKERVPTRYSDISDMLGKLANENHVQISANRYEAKDTEVANLQQISISTQVRGDYNNQMRFINSLERSKMFFVIDTVNLGGGEAGKVQLDMKLETFKRSAQ